MNRCIIKNAHYIGPDRRQCERRACVTKNGGESGSRVERRKARDRRTHCVALDLNWKAY